MAELAKTHILFPKPLLKQIDKIAGAGRRSQFVIEAAKDKLARIQFLGVLGRTAGAWSERRHPALKTQAGINRFLKKIRSRTNKRLHGLLNG